MIIFLAGFVLLLLAWTVTEMIRYSMYAIQLVTTPPYLLTWLRYSLNTSSRWFSAFFALSPALSYHTVTEVQNQKGGGGGQGFGSVFI
jgi:hypothetical protein